MNRTRKLLITAAQRLELPSDVVAGVPRMEIIGTSEFALEKHSGLLEYSKEQISVMTSVGPVTVEGSGLEIKQMGDNRIRIIGRVSQLKLPEGNLE